MVCIIRASNLLLLVMRQEKIVTGICLSEYFISRLAVELERRN